MAQKVKGSPKKSGAGSGNSNNNPRGGVDNSVVLDQICHLQQDTQLMRKAVRELTELTKTTIEIQQRQEQQLKALNKSINTMEAGIISIDNDMDELIKSSKEMVEATREHTDFMIESTSKMIIAFQSEDSEKDADEKARKRTEEKRGKKKPKS